MKQQRRAQKETTQNEISSQKVISFCLFFFEQIKEMSFLVHSRCMHLLRDREKSAHTHSMSISFSSSSFDIYVEREG